MIMLNANKQEIKYAVFSGTTDITTTVPQGTWKNPITGEVYNLDNTTGDYKQIYGEVTTTYVNIALGNNRDEYEAYGFSQADYNGTIAVAKGELNLNEGSLIWFQSEVGYKDGEVDPKSADYTVIGIIPTINEIKYLIKGVI